MTASRVIDQAYLERATTTTDRDFVHLTLREAGPICAVEAVIGSLAANGSRRGEIRPIATDLAPADARRVFAEHIGVLTAEGYEDRSQGGATIDPESD
jgi:hypothetical protein